MKSITDLSSTEARDYFLKASSYFHADMPNYLSFQPIIDNVARVMGNASFFDFDPKKPDDVDGVNYSFVTNKDGRFAWRPLELINPVIYVSLVNEVCENSNWVSIVRKLQSFRAGVVDCCSIPVVATENLTDTAEQVRNWWQAFEQKSLAYSLGYSHVLLTDVSDCYGSLYTHSIAWALHGIEYAKQNRSDHNLLGNKIDKHIRAGRYGQTNGISQGSSMMDLVAELVLGYVDERITKTLESSPDYKILRYRDDYRIFANSDESIERVLKVVSDELRSVGMKLGVSKTHLSTNVIVGSIKPDKLAGIDLQDLGTDNAKTIQKQLLRLHSFGQRFPNSGALQRLVSEFHLKLYKVTEKPDDLEVQVAIATDIGFTSPATFPAVAGILSHLISLADQEDKIRLWQKVITKMAKIPYNGYLEIWLQRITHNNVLNMRVDSKERICKIVNGEAETLWENRWLDNPDLLDAMDTSQIVVGAADEAEERVSPEEIALFREKSLSY